MSDRPHTRPTKATLILTVVTLFWGMSFSLTYRWQEAARSQENSLLAALTLIGLRMILALAVLALWQRRVVFRASRREFACGVVLGALFFAGFALQTWGLAYTTPALSAFFTSICSAWVPLLCLVAFWQVPRLLTLCGLGLGLVGCAVLVDGWSLGFGEALTVAASLFLAIELIALDRMGKTLNPARFSGGFFLTMGLLGMAGAAACAFFTCGLADWARWVAAMLAQPGPLLSLVVLALLPTAVAFHWMNSYQPAVSPSHAALIYLLEPVFSSFFSILLGHDDLTPTLAIGGAIILLGNLLVEVPGWLYGKPA